ncbi:MAG: PD-(D/E)XK nuclease family protein [Akkermansia sp.]
MQNTTPNLFSFATSELSQDAFFLWLLSWASPSCMALDESLHHCAKSFLSLLFDKCGKLCPPIQSLNLLKQHHNIDILCVINEQFYIIIEDKTTTKDHSDQLERYAATVSDKHGIKDENILKFYLKTHDQSNYHQIREKGYTPVTRKDILPLLLKCDTSNQILRDYRDHLSNIEASCQQYLMIGQDSPLWQKDNHNTWIGFYQDIQARMLNDGLIDASSYDATDSFKSHWDKVNSPAKAFMAFFWGTLELYDEEGPNGCIFLQLEHDKFAFKTGWASRNTRDQHLKIHRALCAHSPVAFGDEEHFHIVKPAKMRLSGASATVAIIEGGYMKFNEHDRLDMDKTYECIKAATQYLNRINLKLLRTTAKAKRHIN